MRITRLTNRQLTSTYLFNANHNLEKFSKQQEKLATGRAYTRASQNVPSARKALQARTEMYRNEQYQRNVDAVVAQYDAAEGTLTEISDQVQNVHSLILKAVNGTNTDETSRNIFSETLQQTKDGVLKSLNAVNLDKYILGGVNNKTTPYTLDEAGNLFFNGVNVDDISFTDGVYLDENGNQVPLSKETYIDIGLGLRMHGDNFNKDTAFQMSFSGIAWTGYGISEINYTDKNGDEVTEEVSNNVYQIMSSMQEALEENDMNRLGALNDHMKKQYDTILKGIAELGVRAKKLEVSKLELGDANVRIAEMQKTFEGIEDTDEIVAMEEYNYAWNLTLKFGANLLPQSLMDYIK
jgi:flagellar hook-associated protein 3 FlgL